MSLNDLLRVMCPDDDVYICSPACSEDDQVTVHHNYTVSSAFDLPLAVRCADVVYVSQLESCVEIIVIID